MHRSSQDLTPIMTTYERHHEDDAGSYATVRVMMLDHAADYIADDDGDANEVLDRQYGCIWVTSSTMHT